MLEIHKIKDTEIIKQLATEIKIEYNENDFYLGAIVDGDIAEYLCYKQVDSAYVVMHISDKTGDFQLILGLVKTLVFLADLGRMERVTLPLFYERAAKAVGFSECDSVYELKLADYQNKCGCF